MYNDEPYPVTIVQDRYNGVYSGGKWVAWNLFEWDVPEGASGDDIECDEFWLHADKLICGIGNTPNEAYNALKNCVNGNKEE